jgi:hypothetical protein
MMIARTFILRRSILLCAVLLTASQAVWAQSGKVPPRYVDEWYDRRFLAVTLAGALLGLFASLIWLPQLLPQPHKNDNRRALLHALYALLVSLLLIAGLLLLDINTVAQFGRQSFAFKDLFSDVFLSSRTFTMLGAAALAFALVVTIWTRFLSERYYRYMIIPK